MHEVLKLPAYRRLLIAYALNELAWPIGTVALAVLVYRSTGSAVGAMAYFLAAQFIPALTAPLLVGRIDRLAVRWVLPALYCGEAVAFLLLAILTTPFSLAPILALTIADGALALAARAISRASSVAVTSPAGLLREGNALANALFSICFLAGPAIGGAVVAAGGTTSALYINSGLFVVVALIAATTRGLPRGEAHEDGARRRVRAALAHARERPLIRTLLGVQAVGILFFTMSTPVEIVLVQHSLHSGAGGYGALMSIWGGGSLAGSAVYAHWRRLPSRTLIAFGVALLGIGFIVMAAAPTLAVALAGAAVAGIGNGVEAVAARTALQEAVELEWMALIMSLNESMIQALPGIGIALGGGLAALAGPRVALAVGGGGSLVVIGLVWMLLPHRPHDHPARAVAAEARPAGSRPASAARR